MVPASINPSARGYAVRMTVPERLRTEIMGTTLATPVLLAAGTAGTLDEMRDILDLRSVGGVVTKSITVDERAGNPHPRITWTRAGMLNAIGLANPGLERWRREIAPRVGQTPTVVIGSIAGDRIEDYATVARAMDACEGLVHAELNVSCPNVHSGLEFGADPDALGALVGSVRDAAPRLSLIVKLSPIVSGTPHSIVDLARAAIGAGAAAITLCNTVPAMGIDVKSRRPVLANTTGGLSGPALHPIVTRLIHLVYRGVARHAGVPIIGAGGVTRWEDAAAFILAGASAVQIGAGTFADPGIPGRVARGLDRWARSHGASSLSELVGRVEVS